MRHPVKSCLRAAMLLSVASFALNAAYASGALPSGATVTSGSASISGTSTSTTITQSSKTAIINWNSFSVGKGNTVTFSNGSGATLNRVTGTDVSTIAGNVNATGTIYLINTHGIVVTSTGKVVTGGSFVASTRDISDNDFKKSKAKFSGTSDGTVVNAGVITSKTGDAILIGRSVSNSGTISAANGTAGMAAGDTITFTPLSGDSRISVETDTKGSVTNTGAIKAAQVELNAAGGNVYAIAGNNGGINATGTASVKGKVYLTGGNVQVSGTVTVVNADGTGGTVNIGGDKITLTAANISVKGTTGAGGSISVGSWDTASVDMDSDSTLDASAGTDGDGGSVSVIAQSNTVAGSIYAEGGTNSGNGGSVETSGDVLHLDGAYVNTLADNGDTGSWLLDPYNVTITSEEDSTEDEDSGSFTATSDDTVISVSDLETALKTSNVTISTGTASDGGTQAGDIAVASALEWSANTLTLDATGDINIDADITLDSKAGLILDAGSSINITGTISALTGNAITMTYTDDLLIDGSIDYGSTAVDGASLTINNQVYTLIYDLDTLENLDSSSGTYYALATSLDAADYGNWTPVGTGSSAFSGVFEGLGNTISDLTISSSSNYVGLFGYSTGTIRNVGLVDVDISGGQYVGALAGFNSGTISNSFTSGTVVGDEAVGGLVGENNAGKIVDSYSAASASGSYTVGGLVGLNDGTVSDSYATGSVSDLEGYIGGLIGENDGTVINSYATGAVFTDDTTAGGLVGDNEGKIYNSYATGSVTGADYVGGLAGENYAQIYGSYSTGLVTGYDDEGDLEGDHVGGLVGRSYGDIYNSYATGNVTGVSDVGGLVADNKGTIINAYATGYVTGTSDVGGLIGENSGTVENGYWDTETSGTTTGVGSNSGWTGVTGLTTDELQSESLSDLGFDSSVWGDADGLFPYLSGFYSSDVVAITGYAYTDAGETADAGDSVSVLINGQSEGSASTGANGYYYILADADDVSDSSAVLAYSSVGATLESISTSSDLSDVDIWGGYLLAETDASSLSEADTSDLLAQAAGDYTDVISFVNSLTSAYLVSSDFDIDEDVDGSLVVISNDDADITISVAQTVGDDEAFTVSTGGDVNVDADVAVTDGTSGVLNITAGALNLGDDVSIDYGSTDNGGTLSIGGDAYTLVYSMDELAEMSDDLSGDYALATALDASDYGDWTPVGTSRSSAFSGMFEGLGNTISNLTISSSSNDVGLFGFSSGTLRDIGLINATVSGGQDVGALVGYSRGTVENAYASGSVSGTYDVGGLVGENTGTVTDSYSSASVTGSNQYIGGLVGYNYGLIASSYATGAVSGVGHAGGLVGANFDTISDSYATGTVSASEDNVGGLTGYNSGLVSASYATGAVYGARYVGGLVGQNYGGKVNSSYATGTVSASSFYVGGLTGYNSGLVSASYATGDVTGSKEVGGLSGVNYGTIADSYATGAVSAESYVGGLVGLNETAGTVSGSFATGSVTGRLALGGLVGQNEGLISNVYATGAVIGHEYVGGLAGVNSGTISDSYATGYVRGSEQVGGLIGENSGGTITNGYWDTDTSGTTTGIGEDDSAQTVTGMTTDELQSASLSDLGFDSSVWATGDGLYPYLSAFYSTTPVAIIGYVSDSDYDDVAGVTVSLLVDGDASGSASTGANGYYYILVDSSKIDTETTYNADGSYETTGTTDLFAYVSDGSMVANTYIENYTDDYAGEMYLIENFLWAMNVSETSYSDLMNAVSEAASSVSSSYLLFTASGLNAGEVLDVNGNGDFDIDEAIDASKIEIFTYGDITQSAAITADMFYASAENVTLTNTDNAISAVNVFSDDDIDLDTVNIYSSTDLTVFSGGIDATGDVTLTSAGDITITGDSYITTDADVVLAASGAFINNEGSDAISIPDTSRWLIYSARSDDDDDFNGLDSKNTAVWDTAVGDTVSASGNRYVFAESPVLTVTADDVSKTYGDSVSLTDYSISSLSEGVDGAYEADTASDVYSGTVTLSSDGSDVTANAGTYDITASGLTVGDGYTVEYVGGTLTVDPRAITISADDESCTYGDAISDLGYEITSGDLVNGDTLSGALTTEASSTADAGTYAISEGSLSAGSNYDVTYVGGTYTIETRPITVTADDVSIDYGDDIGDLTYGITDGDLVNGDTLSGALATDATSSSVAGTYDITQGTLTAGSNYDVTFVGGTLTIVNTTEEVFSDFGTNALITVSSGVSVDNDSSSSTGATTSENSSGASDASGSSSSGASGITVDIGDANGSSDDGDSNESGEKDASNLSTIPSTK